MPVDGVVEAVTTRNRDRRILLDGEPNVRIVTKAGAIERNRNNAVDRRATLPVVSEPLFARHGAPGFVARGRQAQANYVRARRGRIHQAGSRVESVDPPPVDVVSGERSYSGRTFVVTVGAVALKDRVSAEVVRLGVLLSARPDDVPGAGGSAPQTRRACRRRPCGMAVGIAPTLPRRPGGRFPTGIGAAAGYCAHQKGAQKGRPEQLHSKCWHGPPRLSRDAGDVRDCLTVLGIRRAAQGPNARLRRGVLCDSVDNPPERLAERSESTAGPLRGYTACAQ